MQEAAEPQGGLSEANKAEQRKAKKARQKADRAQAAAQRAQVREMQEVVNLPAELQGFCQKVPGDVPCMR